MNHDSDLISAIKLDDVLVAQYLQQNPDFFIRNARQIEQMRVPHPVRDSVSLVEWQLGRQRKQIHQLEEEITLLMEQAATNEILFTSLIALQSDLIQADSLQDLLNRLQGWARSMGLAGANIRLFANKWHLNAPSNFTHLALSKNLFEPLRIQRMADKNYYLGTLNGPEILMLIPNAMQIGSVALSLFGHQGDLGMVIFSSRSRQHYQAGMGTLLLEQLSLVLPSLLSRWIEQI